MNIHVIPYTHADYAWTHTRQWHHYRYSFILNEVLDMLSQNPKLTYAIDNLVFLWSLEGREDECKKFIEEGRLEIMSGAISMVRPTQVGGETFIRNILLGQKYLKDKYGLVPINVYQNADTAIGHSQVPQLMKLFGIPYYRGWRPEAAMDEAKIPRQFIWKGLDGSEVITSRGPYFGFWDADSDFYEDELKELMEATASEIIWLSQGMDDTRLLRDVKDVPLDIEPLMRRHNMKFSTPSRYFGEVEKTSLSVVEGVLEQADVGYNLAFKGQHSFYYLRDVLERTLTRLEKLCVLAGQWGFVTPCLEDAWKNYLILCGHGVSFVLNDDYDEALLLYNQVYTFVKGVEKEACKIVSSAAGGDIVVINTELTPRNEYIKALLSFPLGGYEFDLIDAHGNVIEYQTIHKVKGDISYSEADFNDIEILFEANLPAFGYAAYRIESRNSPREEIHSNVNLGESCNLIYKEKPNQLFLTDEVLSEATFSVEKTEITEHGPLRWRIKEYGKLGKAEAIRERFVYKDRPGINYRIEIAIAHKECGYYAAVFPRDYDGELICGIPFGSEKRDLSGVPYGKAYNKGWKNLEHRWNGVFYAKDFVRFGQHTIYGTTTQGYYKQADDAMEVLLFRTIDVNSMKDWEGQFHPLAYGVGRHVFDFSHQVDGETIKRKQDEPLVQINCPGKGRLGVYSLLELTGSNLITSAFYQQNGRYVLRFYESAGVDTCFGVKSDVKINDLKKTDLHGNEMKFTYEVRAHEIVTVEFSF